MLVAGEMLIHAHCYLYRPNLVPFGHRLPYAPHYFLKLKSADALLQVRFAEAWEDVRDLTCVKLTEMVHRCSTFAVCSLKATPPFKIWKTLLMPSCISGSSSFPHDSEPLSLYQAMDNYVVGAAVGESGLATVTAQALNEETHEQAMFMIDAASLIRYRDGGKQLLFAPDR